MTIEAKETILEPLPLPADISDHQRMAKSSQDKILIFRSDEMNRLNASGKGGTIMDIPEGEVISEIGIYPSPLAEPVTSKRGKVSILKAEMLQNYILKRARKGHPIFL